MLVTVAHRLDVRGVLPFGRLGTFAWPAKAAPRVLALVPASRTQSIVL
jgi:hypothetical protein